MEPHITGVHPLVNEL